MEKLYRPLTHFKSDPTPWFRKHINPGRVNFMTPNKSDSSLQVKWMASGEIQWVRQPAHLGFVHSLTNEPSTVLGPGVPEHRPSIPQDISMSL